MKPIVIQGAMDNEIEGYLRFFPNMREEIVGTYRFYHGEFQGYPIIIAKTDIGMAHCAASTALAIAKFDPVFFINQGIAGAHCTEIHVGDIALSKTVISINSFEKPFSKEGIHIEYWVETNFFTDKKYHEADAQLLELFDNAEYNQGKKSPKTLGTGDVWNKEWDFIRWLHTTLGSDTEDMETLACFQVAEQFQIPTVGVRIISNNEILEEAYEPDTALQLQNFIIEQFPQLVALAKEKQESC